MSTATVTSKGQITIPKEIRDLLRLKVGDRVRFITIPELLRHGHPQRENWYRNPSHDMLVRLQEHPAVTGYVRRNLAR